MGKDLIDQLRTVLGLGIRTLQTEVSWCNPELLAFFHHEGFQPAPRFCLDLDLEKTRSPESFEFTTRGAYVFTRCGSLEEAKPLALKSISLGDVARIRFDPDLVELRELPEVREALEH